MKKFAVIISVMLLTTLLISTFGAKAVAAPPAAFPEIIPLPNGFHPEGIAVGNGTDFYVGSLVDGAIYQGDLRTGQGEILVPGQAGRVAVGLAFDSRANQLFVAGGPTGSAYVYNTNTGDTVQLYQLTAPGTFINDVVVTPSAAYFTDSFQPVLYRLPLGPAGQLPDPSAVSQIALDPNDFDFVSGQFNANGIEAPANGKILIVANSQAEGLYRINPATGDIARLDLAGSSLPNADGLVLAGKNLYVVQNFSNQIAVVQLAPDFASGSLTRTITSPEFKVPTTAAQFGNSLYAVNARFDIAPPPFPPNGPQPDVEFQVIQVPRR